VRLSNLLARAEKKLGIGKRREQPGPTLDSYLRDKYGSEGAP
jgi:hypothetical protein